MGWYLGKNVKKLRTKLDLSLHNFAAVVGIAKQTVVNIEAGNNVRSDVITKLTSFFFMYTWEQLSESEIFIPDGIKKQMADHFKGNDQYRAPLVKRPRIVDIIKIHLLKTNHLSTFRKTNEIQKYILDEFNWNISGPSLSKQLNRLHDILIIEKIPGQNKGYRYKKANTGTTRKEKNDGLT